jgi:hypothetical protein
MYEWQVALQNSNIVTCMLICRFIPQSACGKTAYEESTMRQKLTAEIGNTFLAQFQSDAAASAARRAATPIVT